MSMIKIYAMLREGENEHWYVPDTGMIMFGPINRDSDSQYWYTKTICKCEPENAESLVRSLNKAYHDGRQDMHNDLMRLFGHW